MKPGNAIKYKCATQQLMQQRINAGLVKKNEYGNSLHQIINSNCSTIFVHKHYYKFIEPQDDHTCTATYNYRQYFWTTVLLQALPGGERAFEQCRHLLPAGQ